MRVTGRRWVSINRLSGDWLQSSFEHLKCSDMMPCSNWMNVPVAR